jgi:hypothetical protein
MLLTNFVRFYNFLARFRLVFNLAQRLLLPFRPITGGYFFTVQLSGFFTPVSSQRPRFVGYSAHGLFVSQLSSAARFRQIYSTTLTVTTPCKWWPGFVTI